MYSQPLNFAPDEAHLRHAKEREEYVNRLKAYQVREEKVPVPLRREEAPKRAEEKKPALPMKTSDLVLIGAILLLLTEGDHPQDTVLLGILIYLLLG